MRNYESLFIPGLLQTEDYARAVITGTLPMASQTEVEQRVQARLERQELLRGDSQLELWAIVDEASVAAWSAAAGYARPGDAPHRLTNQANLTLQVIPFDVGAHRACLFVRLHGVRRSGRF